MENELRKLYESKKIFEDMGIPLSQEQLKAIKVAEQQMIEEQLFPTLKSLVEEQTRELQGELHIAIHRSVDGTVDVNHITKQLSASKGISAEKYHRTTIRHIPTDFSEPVYMELKEALEHYYKEKNNGILNGNIADYLPASAKLVDSRFIVIMGEQGEEYHRLDWWCKNLCVEGSPY